MNESLLNALNKLKEAINNDPRILKLNELDEQLNKNEEVMKLAYLKDMALVSYEDALKHFKEGSKEVSEAQKRLYEAKLSLDNHPLVKQYNEAYKEVRLIYGKINDTLFAKFKTKQGCNND